MTTGKMRAAPGVAQAHRRLAATRPGSLVMAGIAVAGLQVAVQASTVSPAAAAPPPITELVNRNTAGQQAAGGPSIRPSVSLTASIIAFQSRATNLAPGDTGGFSDVFVRYRTVPMTVRASLSSAGAAANSDSDQPSMDLHAQFVAFRSFADNLVPGDTNGVADIFVRHMPASSTATTRKVSVNSAGQQANAASNDPQVDNGGRFVTFTSTATNMVPGDTNGVRDIFVHDLVTRVTSRVSLGSSGAQANGASADPAISPSGRYVAFSSDATNLVPGDTNGTSDVFVHDRVSGTTTRASVSSAGVQGNGRSQNPSITAAGTSADRTRYFLAFDSNASNLVPGDTNGMVDVFLAETPIHAPPAPVPTVTRVSVSSAGAQGDGASSQPVLTGPVSNVAFTSTATNLVAGDTNRVADVFRRDLAADVTDRRSVATGGAQATGGPNGSSQPDMSPFGRIAYVSDATNLSPGDTVLSIDVFLTRDP